MCATEEQNYLSAFKSIKISVVAYRILNIHERNAYTYVCVDIL